MTKKPSAPVKHYRPVLAYWWPADTAPPQLAGSFLRCKPATPAELAGTDTPTERVASSTVLVVDYGVFEHVPDGRRYMGAVVGARWTPGRNATNLTPAPPAPGDTFGAMMLVDPTPELVAGGVFIETVQFKVEDVRLVEPLELDTNTGTLVAATTGVGA